MTSQPLQGDGPLGTGTNSPQTQLAERSIREGHPAHAQRRLDRDPVADPRYADEEWHAVRVGNALRQPVNMTTERGVGFVHQRPWLPLQSFARIVPQLAICFHIRPSAPTGFPSRSAEASSVCTFAYAAHSVSHRTEFRPGEAQTEAPEQTTRQTLKPIGSMRDVPSPKSVDLRERDHGDFCRPGPRLQHHANHLRPRSDRS